MAFEIEGIKQIDTEELKQLLQEAKDSNKSVQFVDVREPHEYEAGHIPGVPLIPMNSIPSRFKELPEAEEYVFICRSGSRSPMVSAFLKQNGVEHVCNFNGGMLSWTGDVKTGADQ